MLPSRRDEILPTETIRRNPRNLRTHSKKQIRRLAKIMSKLGFTSPIIVDENYVVLAGHARLSAAEELGLATVPVVIVSGLNEAQKRALVLADNKIADMSGYDRKGLAIELQELAPLLGEAGLDIEITGFETGEIDALAADHTDPEADPADDIPLTTPHPVSSRGDIWIMGEHRLLCGDACFAEDVERLMGTTSASMVVTDPPYNVKTKDIQGRGKIKHGNFVAAFGEMSPRKFQAFLKAALSLASKHSAAGSIHFVFMDWRHLAELMAAGKAVYTETKNFIVWVKTNAGQGSFYRSQHEFVLVFKSGDGEHINNFGLGKHGRHRSNVWTYAGANTFKAGRMQELAMHPTVKPVAMIADAIRDCSRRGDVILDPFMGSGTTILAAERTARRAYGLELDPHYIDVAIRRWQAYTKRDAVLDGSGVTFDEVAAQAAAARKGAA